MTAEAMEIVSDHQNVSLISDDPVTAVTVGEPPTKKKRIRVDMKTKLEIVEKFEGGQKTAALSEEYGISQRRIYDFCAVVKKMRAQKDTENDNDETTSKPLDPPKIRPNLRPWVDSFVFHTSDYEGYVTSHEMLLRLIQEFELDTYSGYVVKKTRRSYGKELDLKNLPGKIRWQDSQDGARPQLKCDGIPFIIMGARTLECDFGPDREKKRRAERAAMHERMKDLPPHARKQRRRFKATKKIDCRAKIYIRHIVKFPEYEFTDAIKDRRQREVMAVRMQHDFKRREDIEIEHQYLVQLPTHHDNHILIEPVPLVSPVDHHLAAYIHKVVIEDHLYSSREVKTLLRDYMLSSEELFKDKPPPPRTNGRYWPTLMHIRNLMLLALMRHRDSSYDQSNLENMVDQWQQDWPNDYFFLRFKPDSDLELPSVETNEENILYAMNVAIASQLVGDRQKFLFVHQTNWQRDLLRMYGNEVCILDAAYRSVKHPLPLYFVLVPTNVNFVIVASFILETEDKESVREALEILCSWNLEWTPKYFLTDFSTEEIAAVETIFFDSQTSVYLCDYQRMLNWDRWLSSPVNRIYQHKENVLMILKEIADSETEEEFQENLIYLEGSEFWQNNAHLRRWFQEEWLVNKMRWVKLYRNKRFNAINTCFARLKQEDLISQNFENIDTLGQLMYVLINGFLPEAHQRYLRENIRCSSEVRALGTTIPVFLRNRPMHFVKHMMERWEDSKAYKNHVIKTVNNNVFHVSSPSSEEAVSEVHLDAGEGLPNCQCKDWQAFNYPCKHIMAVITSDLHPSITWDSLPEQYRNSPFITLHLSMVVSTIKQEQDKQDVPSITDGSVKDKTILIQNLAKKVRSLSGEIAGLTYLCQDSDILHTVSDNLEQLKTTLLKSCPGDVVHLFR